MAEMPIAVRQNFLQACINHSTLNKEGISNILGPICDAYGVEEPVDDGLKNFINDINRILAPLNQALTFVEHPLMGEEQLVFYLTSEANISKRQPHLTDAERQYFGELLGKIVEQDDYGIPWMDIFLLFDPRNKITKTRMQDLVVIWINQGYFFEEESTIYFGPRILVEFHNYLKSNYGQLVQDCPLCNKMVLWDVKCEKCKTKVHRTCITKYLRRMSTCPSCNKNWETPLHNDN